MSCRFSRRALLAGAATSLLQPRRACAGRRFVRIGQGGTPTTPAGVACRTIAAAVARNELLGELLHVEVFDEGELGDDLPSLRACVTGAIEIVLPGSTVLSSFHPVIGVLDTPFLFRDPQTARAVLDGPIGDEMNAMLKEKGVNVLAWGENGLRHMTANKPIRHPQDLVGLKLRVPQSEVELISFRALGADAQVIPYLSVYDALRAGDFDAQENPIANIESARFYEVQKVLSLTRHIYSASAVAVSQDLLDDLTPDQRAALARCAKAGMAAMRSAADAAEREGVARLRQHGMTVVSDIDIAAFAAAARPTLAMMGSRFGADFMARLIAAGS